MTCGQKPAPSFFRDGYFLAFALCGAILGVLYALRPISDPDFWWHLKTGEEMVRIRGLLPDNPFWFTGDASLTARELMVLHGYWLWELGCYALYLLAGYQGILTLNILLLLAIYGTLVRLLSRRELEASLTALLLLLSMGTVITYYPLERPQVWSFFFCLGLVALFDRFRDRRTLSGWLFPLMLLWGNVHGGVIVGIVLLGAFLAGVGIQLRHDRRQVVKCGLWAVGGIACGLLSPGTVYALSTYVSGLLGAPLSAGEGTTEFISTLRSFREGNFWVVCLWLLMGAHGAGMLLARRRWLADWLIFLVVLPASFLYMRNIAFFAVALLPQTAYYLGKLPLSGNRPARFVARLGCVALLGLLAWKFYKKPEVAFNGQVSNFYPVKLVEFIRVSGISGNLYNDYDWGGFLLWHLAPETKLFIDGRNLDGTVYDHWLRIRWLSPRPVDGRYEYESLLDRYGVEYVVLKNISKIGLTEPLTRSLLAGEEWLPVYQDEHGSVLVRNLEKYRHVIARHRIEKTVFWMNVLALYQRYIEATGDPQMYRGRGELALYLGDIEAARRDLLVARQSLADDPYLQQLLKRAFP